MAGQVSALYNVASFIFPTEENGLFRALRVCKSEALITTLMSYYSHIYGFPGLMKIK